MVITTKKERQQCCNEALHLISKDTRAAAHQWHQSNDWEVLLMLARPTLFWVGSIANLRTADDFSIGS